MKLTPILSLLALTVVALPTSAADGKQEPPSQLDLLDAASAARLGLDPMGDGLLLRNLGVGNDPRSEPQPGEKGSPFRLHPLSPSELRGANASVRLVTVNDARYCAIGATTAFADMTVQLPDNAQISSVRVFGFDALANDDMTISLVRRCTPPNAAGAVVTTVLSEITPVTSAGNFSQFQSINANGVVDNQSCSYVVRTRFSSPAGANLCAGTQLRLQKVRLSWIPSV